MGTWKGLTVAQENNRPAGVFVLERDTCAHSEIKTFWLFRQVRELAVILVTDHPVAQAGSAFQTRALVWQFCRGADFV